MTKAERTRERIFKTAWLPAATGQDATLFQDAHITYLKEVYRSIWLLGPRGLLVEQQVKAMQPQFDAMLKMKTKAQRKTLHRFTEIADVIDDFEFDHREDLSPTDRRIFNTFSYSRQVTEDLPMIDEFFLSLGRDGVLKTGHLPMVDHALNQAILQVVSMTVNIKRLTRNPDLKPMLDAYLAFCEQWGLPIEQNMSEVQDVEAEFSDDAAEMQAFDKLRNQLNS